MADTPKPDVAPQVQDKRTAPLGVSPKNMQSLVLCCVAAVMVIVVAVSGRHAPTKERNPPPDPPPVVGPNTARIQEYQSRIDEQARKLQVEQAQIARAQGTITAAALPQNGTLPAGTAPNPSPGSSLYQGAAFRAHPGTDPSAACNGLEQEREKRDSLAASNVALSYRKTGTSARSDELPRPAPADSLARALAFYGSARPDAAFPNPIQPEAPGVPIRAPTPDEAVRAAALSSSATDEPRGQDARTGELASRQARARVADTAFSQAEGKEYRLFEGTMLETVLTIRLDSSFSGPVNCMVTTNVYSHSGQHLLMPQGTRVLGEVRRLDSFGQQRLAVFFHRLIMPDGYTVSLDKFQGLNQIGETGLRDQVQHHYLQVFGVSLAIGAIAGLGQLNTRSGLDASTADLYQQGVAASLSQSSLRILDRYLNVLPTMTIREGHRVKVYLTDDVLLPAYEKHQMPLDF
jgi:type IV secretion system protein VirB10